MNDSLRRNGEGLSGPVTEAIDLMLTARALLRKLMHTPGAFPLVVVIFYFLAVLPILAHHSFDTSVFIVAGDRFVDPARLPSPIIVKANSDGFDGEFYYRMALSPFELKRANGIQIDDPPLRTLRILYPLLAWGVALGHAAFVPASLFLVNLFGIGAIAFLATRLTTRLCLPTLTPLAIVLWPGLIVSLTHDTTEIVAAALLLAALDAYFSERLFAYAALGAAAALTRETSIFFLAGVACFEGVRAARSLPWTDRWRRAIIVSLALIPFVIWREALLDYWGQSPLAAVKSDVSWPFLGILQKLRGTLLGTSYYGNKLALRGFELGSLGLLAAFCALVSVRFSAILRASSFGVLAAGWLPVMLLMTMLSADGPLAGPESYFRVFTECFVVGCLILALRAPSRWVSMTMFAGSVVAGLGAWALNLHNLG